MANKLRQLCYNSLGETYLALNPGWEYVDFQQETIIPALEALEAGELERLALFLPAGHSKSEIATKTFIPWYLGRNPQKNVILITHTDTLAKDYGSHVRDTVAQNPTYQKIFPDLKINSSNRASNFFRTSQGNSFYAFGMDGGVNGRRGDLLVIDDPVRSMSDALSDTVQTALYQTYSAVLKDRMRPGFKMVLVMTRWAMRDFAGRVLEAEGKRWHVLAIPAQPANPLKCEGCAAEAENHDCQAPFLWESFYPRERYLEAREDVFVWNAKWQQSPKPALEQGFEENWLRFYVPKYDSQGRERKIEYREDGSILSQPVESFARMNTYMFVDPAMGKSAAHDRTCVLIFGAGPERRMFLLDGILDRLDPGERIAKIIQLIRDWRVSQVLYEEYALVADTYFLRQRLEEEGLENTVIISVGRKTARGIDGQAVRGGRLSKHDRIMQLVPDFKGGRIYLPKTMVRTQADGTKFDIINYFITREYLPYAGEGSIEHDDMLDCMSRLRDPDFTPEFVERQSDDDDDFDHYEGGGTSWESRY